jgi:hypothetical protein
VRRVGFVDLALQFARTRLNFASRAVVQRLAASGLRRTIRQLEAMDFGTRPFEHPREIAEALLVCQLQARATGSTGKIRHSSRRI